MGQPVQGQVSGSLVQCAAALCLQTCNPRATVSGHASFIHRTVHSDITAANIISIYI